MTAGDWLLTQRRCRQQQGFCSVATALGALEQSFEQILANMRGPARTGWQPLPRTQGGCLPNNSLFLKIIKELLSERRQPRRQPHVTQLSRLSYLESWVANSAISEHSSAGIAYSSFWLWRVPPRLPPCWADDACLLPSLLGQSCWQSALAGIHSVFVQIAVRFL